MPTVPEATGLSETQRQIVELARDFARTRVEPHAAEWDRTAHFPRDVLDELGKLGFLGMLAPEAHDGMALDTVSYLLALEEIAAADAGVAIAVSVHHAVQALVLAHGTAAQHDRWLGPLARGESLAGMALGDGDPAAIECRAARSGEAWTLSGELPWVTNGGNADVMIVLARSGESFTAFVVPTDTAGYRAGARVDKMGLRSASTVPVTLDKVRVSAESVLGEVSAGLNTSRLGTAITAVGVARRALEHAVTYSAERKQFGKAIREFEAVQFKLADMATRTEAARALAHAAAARRDRGEDVAQHTGMAKLFASETAMWVTIQAVQLFGGYGYMRDFPVEKLFRDAKGTELYDGTSEAQRVGVARTLYPGP